MADIVFNDRPLSGPRTGIGTYVEQVLAHWPQSMPQPRGALISSVVNRNTAVSLPPVDQLEPLRLIPLSEWSLNTNAGPRLGPIDTLLRPAALRVHSGLVGLAARRGGVYWEPDHIPRSRTSRVVTTVHDLTPLERPDDHPPYRAKYWSRLFDKRLHWTSRFIAVSETTAGKLRKRLSAAGINDSRVHVIPLGAKWPTPPPEWSVLRVSQRLGLPANSVVCLATLEPRKNHAVLLDALAVMPEHERSRLTLVFVGRMGWGGARLWDRLRTHPMARNVLITGHVTDFSAAATVFASRGLVLPSLDEGFGLPPLEAMRLGVPTAVSTTAALRELSDGASLEIDPDDADGWARALSTLATDDSERARLVEAGHHRASMFSWNRSAQDHAKVFAELRASG